MGIDWTKMSNHHLEYFRSRHMPFVEATITGWHYWVFYSLVISYNEEDEYYQIEGVFFVREKILQTKGDLAINHSFHVPGDWLKESNGFLYKILHEKVNYRSPKGGVAS